jgi:integrase/recombinase XerC
MRDLGPGELPTECENWLAHLESQRRLAPLTLENYRRDLLRLRELAVDRAPASLERHDIRRFAARIHAGGLSGRSIARVLSAWRGLYRWMIRQGLAQANPVDGVRAPRAPRTLPRTLTPEQTGAMLDAESCGGLELRDKAMFELLYSAGLRVSELASLDVVGSVDQADQTVTVTGKRGKTRTVPLGEPALAALRAWLDQRAKWAAGDELALFVTRSGRRMSRGAIGARLTRWTLHHGVGQHVHPHMLRHSFASHMLQSSGDLRAVQELLGHASIRSTQVYTHLDFQHLARVYDAAHPRARKR